jgi:exonuclease III
MCDIRGQPASGGPGGTGSTRVRILTLNILGESARDERRAALEGGLRTLNPDVVTFQEAVVTSEYDQVADLLGPDYRIFHQAGRSAGGCGASIASRWPLEVVREADLHVTDRVDPTRWIGSLAVVQIDVPEPIGRLLLVHHKPTWQSGMELERELQAVASARIVEEILDGAERHVVVAATSTLLQMRPASGSGRGASRSKA